VFKNKSKEVLLIMELQNNILNSESLNETNTLEVVRSKLKPGETLILDIGNNYFHQADKLYDILANNGYYVRKTIVNGRNQLLVAYIDSKHQMY
jgi:hypothetical protein